jgi:hypothetical protein
MVAGGSASGGVVGKGGGRVRLEGVAVVAMYP